MSFLKRTASALALGVALAGGAAFVAPQLIAPAIAQDVSTPEGKLRAVLEMQGVPPGILNWSSVEENGSNLIARGVYADVTQYKLGFDTIPMGDMTVSDVVVEGNYVTHFKANFDGIQVDLAELMTTGQKMAQSGGTGAQLGPTLAMMAGYIQGLGYSTLDVHFSNLSKIDLASGEAEQSFTANVKDAFDVNISTGMGGVTPAYLDWAKANALKVYLDQSPEAMAEMEKQMADPNGPIASVGFAYYSLNFKDQGLMPKLEPQLAQARAMMLAGKTELSDDDIRTQVAAMGAGAMSEKLFPVMKAVYNFVMKPDALNIAVSFDPHLTMGELQSVSKPGAAGAPAIDWENRINLEASN